MNKKISLGAAIGLMALAAAVAVTATSLFMMKSLNVSISDFSQRSAMFKKLADVDATARGKYIGTIDKTKLEDSTVEGYVNGLGDKYGSYLDADDYKSIALSNEGQSIGIGVNVVKTDDGYMKIVSIIADSPAESSGVKVNDVINSIGEEDVKATGLANAINLLKGSEGSSVSFKVLRDGKTIPFTITRKKYSVSSVSSKLIGNLGYVKIMEFDKKTSSQFSSQVKSRSVGQIIYFLHRAFSVCLCSNRFGLLVILQRRCKEFRRTCGILVGYNRHRQVYLLRV
ncbi:MAG TPA: PDZ domain-containing protein [Ruminiclostridium sp.]|nr:PDZ domain-containing protein [Ruminiclostridium sp.]